MAHITTNPTFGSSLASRLRSVFAGLREARQRDAEMRRTYNELNGLSERELADIGLRRCDIDDVVRDRFCAR
ncbi:DUF1127 domain-containing protein [Lutimaribacter marinistellae]|uniref:DUF1127 domain-containing protein n=1 Tax=Lutimaribacter marinistellae TaxID=1820329 RepID=A0ABV7THQ4_9RHOB